MTTITRKLLVLACIGLVLFTVGPARGFDDDDDDDDDSIPDGVVNPFGHTPKLHQPTGPPPPPPPHRVVEEDKGRVEAVTSPPPPPNPPPVPNKPTTRETRPASGGGVNSDVSKDTAFEKSQHIIKPRLEPPSHTTRTKGNVKGNTATSDETLSQQGSRHADHRRDASSPANTKRRTGARQGSQHKRSKHDPFLSFVIAARNDDYGAGFMHRMNVFLEQFCAIALASQVSAELVIVEWNPPQDRPSLADTMVTPQKCVPITIHTVPHSIHETLPNSDKIGLYEYYAKNVGIRRAKGEYILVTNPDVIFSRSLMDWLGRAKRNLNKETYYRIDRHDFNETIPLDTDYSEAIEIAQRSLFEVRSSATSGICHALLPHQHVDTRFNLVSPLSQEVFGSASRWTPKGPSKFNFCILHHLSPEYWDVVGGVKDPFRSLGRGQILPNCRAIHTMAPGDFMLMHRSKWDDLAAYMELPLSSNIDSYLIMAAASSGMRQVVLMPPRYLFHMDHGRREQYSRPTAAWDHFDSICHKHFGRRMLSNTDDTWGFNGHADITTTVVKS